MLLQISDPYELVTSPSTPAVGIDFGTTNSLVAIVDENEQPVLLSDDQGILFIPSVVTLTDQGLKFGYDALSYNELSITELSTGKTIHSIKRRMNTPLDIVFEGYRVVDVVGMFFSYLKQRCAQALGQGLEDPQKAVITVPAYFDDTARQATKDAATLGGFDVIRIINEPTAAALAYGLDEGAEGIYAVYDWGGGTFDLSILKMTKGIFQVLATGGDIYLGGDDIDDAIAGHFEQMISHGAAIDLEETPGSISSSPQENACASASSNPTLRNKARQAKEYVFNDQDRVIFRNKELTLTRDDAVSLATPFINKTLALCQRVMDDVKAIMNEPLTLRGVILVGGSSRSWLVQKKVADFFGRPLMGSFNLEHVVAFGAAIQAYNLSGGGGRGTVLVDVAPLSLGIETYGGIVEKIIPRNTPIPTAVTQEFTTFVDGQTSMTIHVVQGEREFVQDCLSLGQFILSSIPPQAAGMARIRVTFTLDVDGILTVKAMELRTKTHQEILIKPSYGLSSTDVQHMLFQSYDHAKGDMEQRFLQQTIIEAQQIIQYVAQALEQDSDLLDDEERIKIEHDLHRLEIAISQKNHPCASNFPLVELITRVKEEAQTPIFSSSIEIPPSPIEMTSQKIKEYIATLSRGTQDFAQARITRRIIGQRL